MGLKNPLLFTTFSGDQPPACLLTPKNCSKVAVTQSCFARLSENQGFLHLAASNRAVNAGVVWECIDSLKKKDGWFHLLRGFTTHLKKVIMHLLRTRDIPECFFSNFLAILGEESTTSKSLKSEGLEKSSPKSRPAMLSLWQKSLCKGLQYTPYYLIMKGTLQRINISHLGKRKIIFKMPFLEDMLVASRVVSCPSRSQTIPTSFSIAHMFCQTQVTRQTSGTSTPIAGGRHWRRGSAIGSRSGALLLVDQNSSTVQRSGYFSIIPKSELY